MRHSDTLGELAKALAKARKELKHPPQSGEANHGRFADLRSCIDTILPVFAKHGLVLVQTPGGGDGCVTVNNLLVHESGEWLTETARCPIHDARGCNIYQSFGQGVTYLRRYSLSAIAGVASDPDDDGHVEGTDAGKATAPAKDKGRKEAPKPAKFLGKERVQTLSSHIAAIPSNEDDLGWHGLREWLVDNGCDEDTVKGEPEKWPADWAKAIAEWLKHAETKALEELPI